MVELLIVAQRPVPARVLALAVALALNAGASGCMDSGDESPAFARELSFPDGRSTRSFTLLAPDPSRHTFDVSVSTAKATDVRIRIHTSEGYELHIVDSTKRNVHWCDTEEQRRSCSIPFPALEAPQAGRWSVIVTKFSQPPADVSIEVTFTRLSGDTST